MVVLWVGASDLPDSWALALRQSLPEAKVRIWPDCGDPAAVDAAVILKSVPGLLRMLPNLRLVSAMGLGVEHLVSDPDLRESTSVVRAVDPGTLDQMRDYIVLNALRVRTRADAFEHAQRAGQWRRDIAIELAPRQTIGLMGYGKTGAHAARSLIDLGFSIRAWTRTAKATADIEHFFGADQLARFLSQTQILICALPLTDQTRGVLNEQVFALLPRGAFVVNIGRGAHLVDRDLLVALESGQISGACLDVFDPEPLPPDHPFWRHPDVRVTPHCAGVPSPTATMAHVADNVRRLMRGEPLSDLVDRAVGY